MADKPKIPLGKPLELTDADLDRLSKITPEDIRKAAAAWRKANDNEYKYLLDTTQVIEE